MMDYVSISPILIPDKIVIDVAKTKRVEWDHVTKWEKKSSETSKDLEDDSTNLNDKLANLMRDM